jgi:dipeptidyl aminopeptidase/acylaminoacyl peptidase
MRKWSAMVVSLVVLSAVPLMAGAQQATSHTTDRGATRGSAGKYDARAFYTTTSFGLAGAHAWSPDGTQLLIHSDATGIFNAYAINVADHKQQPLTSSKTDSTFAVSWFPKDNRILVGADSGGNEITHLFVREASGQLRDLTPAKNGKADFIGWSIDGASFYVATNERDPKSFDVYRYSSTDYARSIIYRNDSTLNVSAVSQDGRFIALVKANSSADSDIYLVDSKQAKPEPKLITKHSGNITHGAYEFTPDAKQLIYATDEHGEFIQAWTYDIATSKKTPLVKADWDVTFVTYSDSGRYRVTGINQDARTVVKIHDNTSGREVALASLPPGDLGQVRFSRDETKLALTVSSDTSPPDVYTVDLQSNRSARLTHALNPAIKEADLVSSQVVRYKSFDGVLVPSVLFKPKTASPTTKVPALVLVHGGPGGQSRTGYQAMVQHLVNHGYAVLAANNRGSSGYGKTFFHMDDKRHGEVDLQDIVYGKNYLTSLDWVDKNRIGIIGGSYGGYMVGAALAFEPDVFKVGINIFGVMNWVRTLTSIPAWWEAQKVALYDELGDPATDAERHRKISPLFHAKNIKVPLLVIQGKNDPRVLQVESDEIVAAVKANKVPVEYIVFPDEGHGFTKRENKIKASDAYVGFLGKYL